MYGMAEDDEDEGSRSTPEADRTLADLPMDVLITVVERLDDIRDVMSFMMSSRLAKEAVTNLRTLNAPLNGIDAFALDFLRSLSRLDAFAVAFEFYEFRHCNRCLDAVGNAVAHPLMLSAGFGMTQVRVCKTVAKEGGLVRPRCACYMASSSRYLDDKYPIDMEFFMPHRQQKVSRRGPGTSEHSDGPKGTSI